jgi:hypothetical protein
VAVIGTTGFASSRVQVQLYFRNALGQYVYKAGLYQQSLRAGPQHGGGLNYASRFRPDRYCQMCAWNG